MNAERPTVALAQAVRPWLLGAALLVQALCAQAQIWREPLHGFDPFGTDKAAGAATLTPPALGGQSLSWQQMCEHRLHWEGLSRRQAAYVALCRSPKLQASIAALKTQTARHGQSLAMNMPSLNFSANKSNRDTASWLVNDRPELKVQGDEDRLRRTGLSLSVPLFASGTMVAAANSTSKAVQAAALDVQEQVDSLLVETLSAYYELYQSLALVEVYTHGQAIARQSVEIARAREIGGVASRSEVLQAQAALARADIELRRAQQERQARKVALATVLSVEPALLAATAPSRAELPALVTAKDPATAQAAPSSQELLAARAAYAAAQARVESAKHRIEQIDREGLPSASLTAGIANQYQTNRGFRSQDGTEKTLSVVMNIPLFEGFARTYKFREASAQADSLQQELQSVRVRISSEMATNQMLWQQELVLRESAQHYLELAQASQTAAMQRYQKGLAEIVEVLNAQRELVNAQAEHLRASVAATIARMKVRRDQGRISEEFEPAR